MLDAYKSDLENMNGRLLGMACQLSPPIQHYFQLSKPPLVVKIVLELLSAACTVQHVSGLQMMLNSLS